MNFRNLIRRFFKRRRPHLDISPDDIFLDSSNLPDFDKSQFEGQIEKTISRKTIFLVGYFFLFILSLFAFKIWTLQLKQGDFFLTKGNNNRLEHSIIFAERGIIYDRNGKELVWNSFRKEEDQDFFKREYLEYDGLSHILGYVGYPLKDSAGNYFQTDYVGKSGIEEFFNEKMSGENGLAIVEKDALFNLISESSIKNPKCGESVTLSIDAEIQNQLYSFMENLAEDVGFHGGSAVIMDIHKGEILSMVSYPEYNLKIMSEGKDSNAIAKFNLNENKPFLNRSTMGLYTPGSIVKPFLAIAALNEDLISPYQKIYSSGSISIQNPYFEDLQTVFKDWKAHGWTDMKEAIAVSSDVYFYSIGGGYKDQLGLGITKINEYIKLFGFSEETGVEGFIEERGVIPNPEWKAKVFDGEDWTIGNTYHTAIGQYGFQITPLQAVRAVSAIANDGKLLRPTILKKENKSVDYKKLDIPEEYFEIIQDGMRLAVTDGTAKGLNVSFVDISAKTGTAERGVKKDRVNSWILGYYPSYEPRYAFVVIMEEGPVENTIGGLYVMRQLLEWMNVNSPEYLE
ncbi:MAG: hypothetical protein KAJ58_01365 [Candidatus Pacebacteria bacterium]|nr:hypothetical protein [Candidatus Paceibacterota bacterium]